MIQPVLFATLVNELGSVDLRHRPRHQGPLFNFEPLAIEFDIRDASHQIVLKLRGLSEPSNTNEAAFEQIGYWLATRASQEFPLEDGRPCVLRRCICGRRDSTVRSSGTLRQ